MRTNDITYKSGDKALTGYLADGSKGRKAPGILVCHQGGGLRDHEKERARMLAELGYVAFALDMYGTIATKIEEAMPLMSALVQNPPELRARARAGLDVLKSQPNVDTSRLAAIGFCFGGGTVIELARAMPELACVVAFHPGLTGQNALPQKDDRHVKPKVLVCAGQLDPLGLDSPAVPLGHPLRERRPQLVKARPGAVAVVLALDQLGQHRLHRRGDREVHVGDPRRQHVVRVEMPLGALAGAQLLDAQHEVRGRDRAHA